MSKKQQTLLQSWSSNKPGAQKSAVPQNVSLLDSDEDDELMRQALEDSLRDYQLKQNLTSPALSSSSGYSTEAPSGFPTENLPGFDSEAGKTWIYPTNKPVRKYQRDIVETCIFQNTLVTLPTGLGMILIIIFLSSNLENLTIKFFLSYIKGKHSLLLLSCTTFFVGIPEEKSSLWLPPNHWLHSRFKPAMKSWAFLWKAPVK